MVHIILVDNNGFTALPCVVTVAYDGVDQGVHAVHKGQLSIDFFVGLDLTLTIVSPKYGTAYETVLDQDYVADMRVVVYLTPVVDSKNLNGAKLRNSYRGTYGVNSATEPIVTLPRQVNAVPPTTGSFSCEHNSFLYLGVGATGINYYDTVNKEWLLYPYTRNATERYGAGLVYEDKIYFPPVNSTGSKYIFIYDTVTKTHNRLFVTNDALTWASGGVGVDGSLYFIPYLANSVLILDPVTLAMVHLYDPTNLPNTNESLFASSVVASNSKIYSAPFYGTGDIMITDTLNRTLEFINVTATVNIVKWRNGVEAINKKLYVPNYQANSLLVIDTTNDTYETLSLPTPDTYNYTFTFIGPDNNVYVIRASNGSWVKINPFTHVVSQVNYSTVGDRPFFYGLVVDDILYCAPRIASTQMLEWDFKETRCLLDIDTRRDVYTNNSLIVSRVVDSKNAISLKPNTVDYQSQGVADVVIRNGGLSTNGLKNTFLWTDENTGKLAFNKDSEAVINVKFQNMDWDNIPTIESGEWVNILQFGDNAPFVNGNDWEYALTAYNQGGVSKIRFLIVDNVLNNFQQAIIPVTTALNYKSTISLIYSDKHTAVAIDSVVVGLLPLPVNFGYKTSDKVLTFLGHYALSTSTHAGQSLVDGVITNLSMYKYNAGLATKTGGSVLDLPGVPLPYITRYPASDSAVYFSTNDDQNITTQDYTNYRKIVSWKSSISDTTYFRPINNPYLTKQGITIDSSANKQGLYLAPNTHNINIGTGDYTFAVNVYMVSNGVNLSYLFYSPTDNVGNQFIAIGSGNLYILDPIVYGALDTGINIGLNQWYHIVCMRQNGVMYVFIGGILQYSVVYLYDHAIAPDSTIVLGGNGGYTTSENFIWDDLLLDDTKAHYNAAALTIGEKAFIPPPRKSNMLPSNVLWIDPKYHDDVIFALSSKNRLTLTGSDVDQWDSSFGAGSGSSNSTGKPSLVLGEGLSMVQAGNRFIITGFDTSIDQGRIYTIDFWCRRTATASTFHHELFTAYQDVFNASGLRWRFTYSYPTDSINLYQYPTPTHTIFSVDGHGIPIGEWVHYAMVIDCKNKTCQTIINGVVFVWAGFPNDFDLGNIVQVGGSLGLPAYYDQLRVIKANTLNVDTTAQAGSLVIPELPRRRSQV